MDPTSFDQLARALTRAASPRLALATVRDRFRAAAATPPNAPAVGPRLLASRPPAAAHGRPDLSDGVTRFPLTACDAAYNRCADQAQFEYDLASFQCRLTGNPSCETAAQQHRERDLASCAKQFGCPPDDCQIDRIAGYDARCCPEQEACGGACRPICPERKLRVINDVACQCVCDPLLKECEKVFDGLQRIRDSETCLCRCPTDREAPCTHLIGGRRDPSTCRCACLDPLVPCDGVCVDLQTDPNNCGTCGTRCGLDQKCCDGICTTLTSNLHCGDCGIKVQPPWTCCVASGSARGVPTLLDSDLFNCGTCGTRCGPDQKCCDGVCTTLTSDQDCGTCGTNLQPPWQCCVPDGSTRGMPTLIGTSTDCADCDDVCSVSSDGSLSSLGTCCPPDATHPTSYCDPGISPQHCGLCGQAHACVGRELCCHPPFAPRRPYCADPITSNTDCGRCGNPCAAGRHCDGGHCVCDAGRHACGGLLPSGPVDCCDRGAGQKCCLVGTVNRCVDTTSDAHNCGDCGIVCPSGKICVHSQCVCPAGGVACGAGCCPPAASPAKTSCCSGVCVDLQTDRNHCGACPMACRSDQTCVGGHCVCPMGTIDCVGKCCRAEQCCPDGCCPRPATATRLADPAANTTCCAGQCVDAQTDVNHCGSTCLQCVGDHYYYDGGQYDSPASCVAGHCVCGEGFALCDDVWCMPTVYPGTSAKTRCCLPNNANAGSGHYVCPLPLECCNVVNTGTGYSGCCFPRP